MSRRHMQCISRLFSFCVRFISATTSMHRGKRFFVLLLRLCAPERIQRMKIKVQLFDSVTLLSELRSMFCPCSVLFLWPRACTCELLPARLSGRFRLVVWCPSLNHQGILFSHAPLCTPLVDSFHPRNRYIYVAPGPAPALAAEPCTRLSHAGCQAVH